VKQASVGHPPTHPPNLSLTHSLTLTHSHSLTLPGVCEASQCRDTLGLVPGGAEGECTFLHILKKGGAHYHAAMADVRNWWKA